MEEVELSPIKIFYSYARTEEDTPFRNELEKHLANLKRQKIITNWSEQNVRAGGEREQEISQNLEEADIILVLISSDFMDSNYYDTELQRALEKQKLKQVEVIPIIIRPVNWDESIFSHLQALPTNNKAVSKWNYRDEAFVDIVKDIKIVVNKISALKYTKKAEELLSNNQPEQSLVFCEKAIKMDNTLAKIFFVKGEALRLLCSYFEALTEYRQASELEPNNAEYHANVGNALREYLYHRIEPEFEYNIEDYDEEEFESIYANYSNTLSYLVDEESKMYREAIAEYRIASEIDPDNADYLAKIGGILNNLRRYEEALSAYKEAAELNPDNADYYSDIGNILYYGLNLKRKALEAYEKAIELNPQNAAYYGAQAIIFEKWEQEMQERAIELRKKEAELKKNQ
jgi:tetratricopeptide (TPR) repeat protein